MGTVGVMEAVSSRLSKRREPQVLSVRTEVLSDNDIPMTRKVIEDLLSNRWVGFNDHQSWVEPLDRESLERLRLVQLDVHRQKVDFTNPMVIEDVVKGCCLARNRIGG